MEKDKTAWAAARGRYDPQTGMVTCSAVLDMSGKEVGAVCAIAAADGLADPDASAWVLALLLAVQNGVSTAWVRPGQNIPETDTFRAREPDPDEDAMLKALEDAAGSVLQD